MEQVLHVSENLGTTTALTREQGQIIYEKICSLIDAGHMVSLDFSDIESILSPFLNVAPVCYSSVKGLSIFIIAFRIGDNNFKYIVLFIRNPRNIQILIQCITGIFVI